MSQDDPTNPTTPSFADLGLRSELVAVLDQLGYEEPTPIQLQAIPLALRGTDLLGQAATGTGKTAAFALPILQRLAGPGERGKAPLALVLVPTRELAMQVSEAVHTYGRTIGSRVLPIYGGQPIVRQLKELTRGVDVVVATPGRALDHLSRGSLSLAELEMVVLDEADEMLDMGFAEDIEAILERVPDNLQTLLFSATMPGRISGLAGRHLSDPVRITIEHDGPTGGEDPQIREVAYVVSRHHKPAALARVLDVEGPDATLVFCRTRNDVDELTQTMNGRGYRAEALHGGMTQEQRDRVMGHVRSGSTDLLIATDVAARGLDIDTLTHVVNHSVPSAPESYVHRIGRVGRAGREGVAITLVAPREHRALRSIERHTGRKMEIESVPTVADLRARRLELIRAAMREAMLLDEELDTFRPVVESLGDEFDLVQIALAAIKLVHDETSSDGDDRDVPDATLDKGDGRGGSGQGGKGKGSKTAGGKPKGARRLSGEAAKVWISLGRDSGVRPKDLVGAIANETSLTGGDVGAIQISGRFSLVEVPEAAVEEVISALSRTRIRGNKGKVRRDRVG
ncbi:MAG: DEAD/DEAH box helicase [Euzebya sp.]